MVRFEEDTANFGPLVLSEAGKAGKARGVNQTVTRLTATRHCCEHDVEDLALRLHAQDITARME